MNNKKKLYLISGILVLSLFVGTIAYFSGLLNLDNLFSTKSYGGTLIERFTPEESWEPGMEVNKDVTVKNTGEYDLFVRIRMEEVWERDSVELIAFLSSNLAFNTVDPVTLLAVLDSAIDDGVITGDESVVLKKLVGLLGGGWTFNNGYYYFNYILGPGETTTQLLDSVVLAANADMGNYLSKTFYQIVNLGDPIDEDAWIDSDVTPIPVITAGEELYRKAVTYLDPDNKGYAQADYTLTIITELVQATPAAATGWFVIPTEYQP